MRMIIAGFAAAACVALCAVAGNASWTASVSGSVVDVNSLQPVSGAIIKVYSVTGTRLQGSAKSDASGTFVVTGLAGGQYRLQFEGPGYQRTVVAGIYVRPTERLIEAAPIAMYPVGVPVPRPISMNPCGSVIQPGETADVYVVCSGD
jgi:hypothetical protein